MGIQRSRHSEQAAARYHGAGWSKADTSGGSQDRPGQEPQREGATRQPAPGLVGLRAFAMPASPKSPLRRRGIRCTGRGRRSHGASHRTELARALPYETPWRRGPVKIGDSAIPGRLDALGPPSGSFPLVCALAQRGCSDTSCELSAPRRSDRCARPSSRSADTGRLVFRAAARICFAGSAGVP